MMSFEVYTAIYNFFSEYFTGSRCCYTESVILDFIYSIILVIFYTLLFVLFLYSVFYLFTIYGFNTITVKSDML